MVLPNKQGLPYPKTGFRFLTTYRYVRDPYGCYRTWRSQHGDTFIVNALNGDVVATCAEENIRATLKATSDEVSQFATQTTAPLLGPTSVLLIDGPRHNQERRILSPSFHGPCIRHFIPRIRDIAKRTSLRFSQGETFLVMDAALEVSLNVIIEVVFGVEDERLVERFRDQITKFVQSFHPMLAFTRLFQRPWLGLSPWNRFVAEKTKLEAMLDEEIGQAIRSPAANHGLLSRMLAEYEAQDGDIDRNNVRYQLLTLLLAGHETTQIAIAWAMSWLHRSTDHLEQLRDQLETDGFDQVVADSQLLDGICNESLRLNPIIPDFVRTLKEPLDWSDVTLPPKTNVALATFLVHEDPRIYPEPQKFRPERWLNWKPKPHEFLPFGGGVRRCLGAPLSVLEMKTVILQWIEQFDFALPDSHPASEPVYRRNITMAPRTGIPLIIKRRR